MLPEKASRGTKNETFDAADQMSLDRKSIRIQMRLQKSIGPIVCYEYRGFGNTGCRVFKPVVHN